MSNARKHRLIVLENGVLESMAHSKEFLNAFPVLKKILAEKVESQGCGGCGSAAASRADTYQTVKQTLAGLATRQKSRLKEMLDTDKVQIIYRGSSGKAIKNVF